MYQIAYHPRTDKFLKKIPLKEAQKILIKVHELAHDPFSDALDVKKLTTTESSYRLRVGTVRIIYEIDTRRKLVSVHDIDFRGSIY